MATFTLTAFDLNGPNQWCWRLTDSAGNIAAPLHPVELETSDGQYAAWLDLSGYLRIHAAPDNRREDERRMIGDAGRWIGEQVLGPQIGQVLVDAARDGHVTVRVTVERPEDAPSTAAALAGRDDVHHLMFRPLELAHAGPDDRPLSVQDVSLVFDSRPTPLAPAPTGAGQGNDATPQPLRMLAVFSLPVGVSALNLRHERYQLRRMIQAVAVDHGLDVELRVLQYGVTRAALKDMLREGPGWDVLHFSGHGLESRLVLEKDDGTRDVVDTTELVELLRPTRQRLKWVTLSSCLSAAATAEETLRWLGIDPHRDREAGEDSASAPAENEDDSEDQAPARRMPVLARSLADELDCAVLAMRFPVGDQFAIDLGRRMYDGVLRHRQPLDRALQLALPELVDGSGDSPVAYPPLSVATPALFGAPAAGLELSPAQKSRDQLTDSGLGLIHFPRQAEHFVGRVAEMTAASRALASQSGQTGVLFHGMAGAGKTACATELAWQHEDLPRFRHFVWYKAPDADKDVTAALRDFASTLETQLPGVELVHLVDRPDELRRTGLPRLVNLLRQNSVLLVLDNLESLLFESPSRSREPSGTAKPLVVETPAAVRWHDPAWGDVLDALLSHDGESRVVLTSRLRPPVGESEFARQFPAAQQQNPAERLLTRAVHALSLDEAALLARQLPNLGRILEGRHADDGQQREAHRQLVARMLRLVQGHPKLLELAEGQATDPAALESQLDRAQAATLAGGRPLTAFFEEGRSALEEDDVLHALSGWTEAVTAGLPDDARQLFAFLCCLEEDDREEEIVNAVWPNVRLTASRRRRRDESADNSSPASPQSPAVKSERHSPDDENVDASGWENADASGLPLNDADQPSDELAELLAGIDPSDPSALAKLMENPLIQQQMQQQAAEQQSARAGLEATLDTLSGVGLVEVARAILPVAVTDEESTTGDETGTGRIARSTGARYGIHPGVAEAGRELAGSDVQQAVDAELSAYWITNFQQGIQTEMQGGGGLIRLAGLRAAPYLMRAARWQEAATLLEDVLSRDESPATVAALLPLLRHIAEATAGTELGLAIAGILANALLAAGRWQEAEAMMRDIAAQAKQQGQFRVATGMLGEVINIMQATGRAEAALDVVERMKQATRNAGLGPWTQLGNDVWRLQLLGQLGHHEDVLAEVERYRETMSRLSLRESSADDNATFAERNREGEAPAEPPGRPARQEPRPPDSVTTSERKATIEEAVVPWNVRETLLDTGRSSAMQLERWDEALALNAEVLASKQSRHASELEQARFRYNDYGPLLRLQRFDDVRRLLVDCRRVFEEHNHVEMLGKVFSALADLEDKLGHFDRAAAAEHNALRYTYLAGDPGGCAISHFNLANYLLRGTASAAGADDEPEPAAGTVRPTQANASEEESLAHRLACAMLEFQISSGGLAMTLDALARHLTTLSADSPAHRLTAADGSGFDSVVGLVEQIEGVRFADLFARLPTTRAATGPEALAQVLALAADAESSAAGEMPPELAELLAPLLAAAEAGEDVQPHLDALREQMTQAIPGQPEAIDQFMNDIAERLGRAGDDAE